MTQLVLIVEDHKETADMVAAVMETHGLRSARAGSLGAAREFLKHQEPDLIVLDLTLPDGNGLELCRKLRASARLARTPIIALTGMTELCDKKLGFSAGLDQYLEKPMAPEELWLWAAALLRRADWEATAASFAAHGDLHISAETFLVKFRGAVIGNLTRREFDLLNFLVKASPKPVSRREIIEEAWKTFSVENLVDTHIHNLRAKLPRPLAARIQSVPSRGFRYFAAP